MAEREQVQEIFDEMDFYVPTFEVRLKGRSLDRDVLRDVLSVTYTDSLEKLDSCQLTLNNWDDEKRTFKYLDFDDPANPPPFMPGTAIELFMGYHDRGDLTLMLRGQVVSLEPDFPAGGQPTVQVRALNQLYKLHFKTETEVYPDMTDSEIAAAVIDKVKQGQNQARSEHGHPPLDLELKTLPENLKIEERHEYVVIENDYPIVFLMERARHNGYDIYIEEVETAGRTVSLLHFHRPNAAVPATYRLTWGRTLINFKPTLTTKGQVSKVTVRGWDSVAKKEIVGSATWDDLPFTGLPNIEAMGAVDSALAGAEVVIANQPVHTQEEATAAAKDHLAKRAKGLVSGSGGTVGVPELRAGRPLVIEGLGDTFSGRYLLTETTHTIGDGGYTTTFVARMETVK